MKIHEKRTAVFQHFLNMKRLSLASLAISLMDEDDIKHYYDEEIEHA